MQVESENDPRAEPVDGANLASWTADIPFQDPPSDRAGSAGSTMNGHPSGPGMPEGQITQRSGRFGPIQFTSVVYRSSTPQAGGGTTQRTTTRTTQPGMATGPGTPHEHTMNPVFQNFQELLRDIMGGGGRTPDSPADTSQPGQAQPQPGGGGGGPPPGFPFGSPGGDDFPPLMGAHITYTSQGPLFPRDANNPQPQAHPVEDLPG